MPHLPTGTVTFLFTDIEGSTRLVQELGDRYPDILESHRRILRSATREQKGYEFETQGDGLFVAFSTAEAAVEAAVKSQRDLEGAAWPEGRSVHVRMGVHTGQPTSTGSAYVGLDLHRTARICNAGHGGQILVSRTTRYLVEDNLPSGVAFRDLGEHRLKDLARPEHLFQVLISGLRADFPPVRSLDAGANNLPTRLTTFVGREREKGEIKGLLATAQLLTLAGPGGSGKTRLALEVAGEMLTAFRDGVWFVDLAPHFDPDLISSVVALTLGIREQPGRPILETLLDNLAPQNLLLVLDGCEHVATACAVLADELLRRGRSLRILATSREELGTEGEVVWRVPPLSLPEADHPVTPQMLTRSEAARLFIDRAVAVQRGFSVTGANAPAIAQVCQRLDGNPLAIELAAARVPVLSAQQIVERLDDRFRLLTSGSRTALPRHQTLRATIDWSYDLLPEQEGTLFRRLSIFAGGFTLKAAESICSGPGEALDILDLLAHLVHRSLVLADGQPQEVRYRLLESVRQYGREKLRASGEESDVRLRHCQWHLELAEHAEPLLVGPDQILWLDRLETDHDDLRMALEWASAVADDGQVALRLASALGWFWEIRGYLSEGRKWLERALRHAGGADPGPRVKALYTAGRLAQEQGDYVAAQALCTESLRISREIGHRRGIARSLRVLGSQAIVKADYSAARPMYEESLAILRELDDKGGIAWSLRQLGAIALGQGDDAGAHPLLDESVRIARDFGARRIVAAALVTLGHLARLQGDHKRAACLYGESLALLKDVRDKPSVTSRLEGLAAVARAQGQLVRAARLYGVAEAIRATIGAALSPPERAEHDRSISALRHAMDAAAFTEAWSEGQAMTLDQAVEHALKTDAV